MPNFDIEYYNFAALLEVRNGDCERILNACERVFDRMVLEDPLFAFDNDGFELERRIIIAGFCLREDVHPALGSFVINIDGESDIFLEETVRNIFDRNFLCLNEVNVIYPKLFISKEGLVIPPTRVSEDNYHYEQTKDTDPLFLHRFFHFESPVSIKRFFQKLKKYEFICNICLTKNREEKIIVSKRAIIGKTLYSHGPDPAAKPVREYFSNTWHSEIIREIMGE